MPTKIEKDSVTGTETTGHEWDGIKELNTPLPKWWLYVMYATIVWSIGYYILFPSIPYWTGYFEGVLGYSSRAEVEEKLDAAAERQSEYLTVMRDASPQEILEDPQLLNFALSGGQAAFADNCAPCHAPGGAGRPGYPVLADDAWIWGGTMDEIQYTLLHGIRWDEDSETRFSEMPAFGQGILDREQIAQVANFVLSLSGEAPDPEAAEAGAEIFAANCTSCHGENGTGDPEFGAPNLADQVWLYGGTETDIRQQVTDPRHGVMPAWGERLDPETIKMLVVYVHSLGGGE